jgi:hypothetical protein
MLNASTGIFLSEVWADHEFCTSVSVGGSWVSVGRLILSTPYVDLAVTILVATAAAAICIRHAKHRKEEQ